MAATISLYKATLAGRLEVYNAYLAAGKGTPFLYPWDTLPVLYLFLGMLIRSHLSASQRKMSGYVVFLAVVVHSAYICLNRRTLGFASGYGIGLTFTWGVIISLAFLLLHEIDKDYVRLELREAVAATTYTQTPDGVNYSTGKDDVTAQVKNRKSKDFTQSFTPKGSKQNKTGNEYRLIWQPFPKDLGHSIDWTIDLMTSFRGPNWNFRIPTLPTIKALPPPSQFKTTRAIEASMLANETQNPSDPNSTSLQRKSILDFVKLYLILDILKAVLITDPYFLGLRSLDYPSPWPILHDMPLLTRFVRLIIAMVSVVAALGWVFSLEPLFFYVVMPALIPQSTLIKITRSPLYDPRMYGVQFTSPLTTISKSGLAGFWGKCWHQMFRYGVSEPSRPVIKALNLDPKSQLGRAIQLLVAFCFSGAIHAVAASTTFSIIPAKPWQPWLFFMSQGVGIIIQTSISNLLTKQMKLRPPVLLRQLSNWAFLTVWLWYTGPWLSDDFARAGIWLFEPVPISFVRGVMGEGWWHWNGKWAGFWKGDGIFSSGVGVF